MGRLIKAEYFNTWLSILDTDIRQTFETIQQQSLEPHSFTFYTSVSVMSSSRIEGEQLDVDSYVKHKILYIEYLPELTEKPNDLYRAYLFAHDNKLNQENLQQAHTLIAQYLLPEHQRGAVRTTEMLIMEHNTGRIQYEAAPCAMVLERYNELWQEIEALLNENLNLEEVFYYAALIHLVFVKIHPFNDGNGRTGRLLEKWFLARKLGEKAWYIGSERYYYQHLQVYYNNLARTGLFYDELNYDKAVPFLLMLPNALIINK